MTHEGVLEVLRNNPGLIPKVLKELLGVPLPPFKDVRVDSEALGDVKPAAYQADLVVQLMNGGRMVKAVVAELQLDRKRRKRRVWMSYIVNLGARLDGDVCLLIIAPEASVARWCRRPIETGHPGFVLTPLVLGPDDVPKITDPEAAIREPELAVLSAVAHGKSKDGLAIGKAVFKAIDALDEERQKLYADLSFLSMNDAARAALEAMMKRGYEYQSDFAKKYFGQGLEKGRAEDVLAVLDTRGVRVPKTVRERVMSCSDLEVLGRWLRRAVTVSKAAEIFEEQPA